MHTCVLTKNYWLPPPERQVNKSVRNSLPFCGDEERGALKYFSEKSKSVYGRWFVGRASRPRGTLSHTHFLRILQHIYVGYYKKTYYPPTRFVVCTI